MDRRTFLTYSSAALDGKPVDAELVDLLEATGQKLTSFVTEQRQHTRTLLDAHLTTVTDLIDGGNYTQHVGQRLHTLAARMSSTVGWHRFDQGKHAAAGRFWHGALHSAHASGDRALGAGIMSDLACARPVIDLVPVRSAGVESK